MASGDVSEAVGYPVACLGGITDAGIPQACADIERVLFTPTQTGDAGAPTVVELTSASCAAAANETCACTLLFRYVGTLTTGGSYTTSGNQVTIVERTSDGGVRDAGADPAPEYCVSGNTLTLHFLLGDSSEAVMTLTR